MIRAGLVLFLVAFVASWPGLDSPSWSGTEGRRVQIAKEMVETGDLVVPRLGGEPTLTKPPLYYWVVAAAIAVFGDGAFAVRAPSVLSFWLLAWLAFAVLRRSHDELTGWLAALGLLCTPALLWHLPMAEIDPMFAAFSAASILLLGRAVGRGAGVATVVAAGFAGSAALLTKGAPFAMFLLGALLVWWRHARLRGLVWYLIPLLVPPAIYYAVLGSRDAAEGIAGVAQEETFGRILDYGWRHVLSLPDYALRVVLSVMPFALWTFAEHRGVHEARLVGPGIQQRFCSAAALAAVLVIAVFPGRPTRYLLPAVALFVCAVAPAVAGWARYPAVPGPLPRGLVRGLAVLGALALCVLPFMSFPLPGRTVWFALALALAPAVVATRPAVVAYALALPVLAMWTVVEDRAEKIDHGIRSKSQVAALLREQLVERRIEDLATYGHFDYSRLFGDPRIVPGDEFVRRPPSARWILFESPRMTAPPGWVERVRIRIRGGHVVLAERTE